MTGDDHTALSTTAFARRCGCSSEIVRQWCAQGMDGVTRTGRNYKITDPAAAEAWMKRKGKKGSIHGGKRARAGRKANWSESRPSGREGKPNASAPREHAHGSKSVGSGDGFVPGNAKPYYERSLDDATLELQTEKARAARIANDEKLGRLIPHEQFEALVAAVCAGVRTRLETYPSIAAGEIVRELGLGAEAEPAVRDLLERHARRIVAVIKTDPRGQMTERDPELWQRLMDEDAA